MQCGRFLLCAPKTSRLASFFSEKNSRLEASEKGWIGLAFVNLIARGCFREWRSVSACWTICEAVLPRRNNVFFGFSTLCGAFFSSALFERALRGFLTSELASQKEEISGFYTHICRNIAAPGFPSLVVHFCVRTIEAMQIKF